MPTQRITLMNTAPPLSGTRPPVPQRLMTTLGIRKLLGRVILRPSPKTVSRR